MKQILKFLTIITASHFIAFLAHADIGDDGLDNDREVILETRDSESDSDSDNKEDQIRIIDGLFRVTQDLINANDYVCGSVNIQVQGDWKIKSVKVHEGTIQNQFQFRDNGRSTFKPKFENTRFIQVKQATGYTDTARTYVFTHPIDVDVTLVQIDGANETTYRVQKGTCNAVQLGKVKMKFLDGIDLPYFIRQSERDDQTWFVHSIRSEYYTPANILIPSNIVSD